MTKKQFIEEVASAATIIESFKGIPAGVLKNAKGIAVLHVSKVAVGISERHGHGIVVSRLPEDGALPATWSAPAAIHTSGWGAGEQVGIEVEDLVFVLNTEKAVSAFAKGHNWTVGTDVSIAAGPLGAAAEFDGTVREFSAIYTYSHAKGLFAGVAVEIGGINQRSVINAEAYGVGTTGEQILNGVIERPEWADVLYQALKAKEFGEE
ncbi:SH3 domain-containing YSC84-like protein 1 [Rhizoclosmatium sp. JEL0117]|nr:SH3 domain-containing YSC84-like protein 1 [Rhizoclosmatium sp. JEL0117]